MLLILKSVHARPESVVNIGQQLLLIHKPLERFAHEFFVFPYVIEDLVFENEVSAVYPQVALIHRMDSRDQASIVQLNQVIAEPRLDAHKTSGPVVLPEMLDLLWERQVGEAVAVIGQEHIVAIEVVFYRF